MQVCEKRGPVRVQMLNQRLFACAELGLLQRTPEGIALAEGAGIGPVGPERGRNVDIGIEQGMWRGRARVR